MAKEFPIGEFVYVISTLPALEQLALLPDMVPVFGAIQMAAGAFDPVVASKAFQDFGGEKLVRIATIFAKTTMVRRVDGTAVQPLTELTIDMHFQDRLFDLLSWMAKCVAVNYETFLAGCVERIISLLTPKNSSETATQ